MNCGDAFNPERSECFSYGCCFVPGELNQFAALIAKEDPANGLQGFDLYFENGHLAVHLTHRWPNNFLKVLSAAPISRRWHHVMMTYDGSSAAAGVRLYIDGQAVQTAIAGDLLTETIKNKVPLLIGSRQERDSFQGAIDDVCIYNRSLSSEEVQQLFQSAFKSLAGVRVEDRTTELRALLAETYRSQDEPLKRLLAELTATNTALRDARWKGLRRWRVNSQGQTMIIFPETYEDGRTAVDHAFEMSSHEVTVAEFRRFREDFPVSTIAAPVEDCPVHRVSWFGAAQYCNWLSEQEGIPEDQWVYEPNSMGQYGHGMRIKTDYLELNGYRMPNAHEWETACRSNTKGSFCFGEPEALLKRYAVNGANSGGHSFSAESLLPNDAGLFDMHGNVYEWIQNPVSGPFSPVLSVYERVMCGGSFRQGAEVTSADRYSQHPGTGWLNIGFRVCRTCDPDTS